MAEDVIADFPLECTSVKFYDWGEATVTRPSPPVFWTNSEVRQMGRKDVFIACKMVESVASICPHAGFLMLKYRVIQPPLRAEPFSRSRSRSPSSVGRLLPRGQSMQEAELCMLDSSPTFTKQMTPPWRWEKVGQEARSFRGQSLLQGTGGVGNKRALLANTLHLIRCMWNLQRKRESWVEFGGGGIPVGRRKGGRRVDHFSVFFVVDFSGCFLLPALSWEILLSSHTVLLSLEAPLRKPASALAWDFGPLHPAYSSPCPLAHMAS